MMREDNQNRRLSSAAPEHEETVRPTRQRAEREAEATLREQANLLNLTHDAIYVRDMDGVLKYWNRGAEQLYGWTSDEALGKAVADLLKTVFPVPFRELQAELLREGRWEGELVHTKKDGTAVVVGSRWSLQRDERGAPVAVLVTNHDITERKRAEQARQEMEEQWRAAFESNPTMNLIVDVAGTIVSTSAFGAAELGYGVSELVGQPALNFFHEPDRQTVQSHAEACFQQPGRMVRWEARKIRKDGTMLWVRETAKAVVLKNRPVLLVVCEDITEQRRAEEAARRSERELRDVIETIPAVTFSAFPDGEAAWVNRRWVEYSGMTPEASSGHGWQSSVHPDDLEGHLNRWRGSLASGEPFESEVRHRGVNGEYRWFLVRAVPLRGEHGQILKWYGTLTDIEDRKQVEALLAGEKRILEMAAKGDSLGQILDSLCRLVEQQAGGVLASILLLDGKRLRHGAAPSLPKAYTDAIDGAAIGPSAGSCGTAAYWGRQVIVEDIATDRLWAEYRDLALPHSLRACWSTPVFSSQGKVIATFAMYYREPRSPSQRDQDLIEQITHLAGVAIERKLTQEKLRRSEAYLSEAQRLTHTGSWAVSPITRKVYWSEEMFAIWGFDPKKGPPDPEALLQRFHPDDLTRARAEMEKVFSGSVKVDAVNDFRIVLPDGTLKYIDTTYHPVFDDTGKVVEYVGTSVDVTERKRAEEERERLRQLEGDLAHINRVSMMGELAASLAHEIKQPITAATTNAKTLLRWLEREPAQIDEARQSASRIVQNVGRASDIINGIRALYTKGAPQRELVDVNELIGEMIVLLRNEASRYSIPIGSDLAKDLPRLFADRVQLQQVMMNLMLNGIEAMKDRPGALTARSQRAEDGQLLISISDTGVGLPTEIEDQIFNAFFTTKPQGTGMGLTISRSIVEAHGGRLWATRNSGRGTTFHFTLPSEPGARQ